MRNSSYFGAAGLGLTKPVVDPVPVRALRDLVRPAFTGSIVNQILDRIDVKLATFWTSVQSYQAAYFTANGRYWQGILTPTVIPRDGEEFNPNLAIKPTGQAECWPSVLPSTLPMSVEVHTHDGQFGKGYTGIVTVRVLGESYSKFLGSGAHSTTSNWARTDRPDEPTLPLPQSVYDAIANPAIPLVVVRHGHYTLPSRLEFRRSNLDLDFNGSTLVLDQPTGYPFLGESEVDAFVDVASPARNASHLTGTIATGTKQLTMDAAEIMDVAPGEIVTIVAGVNNSDPVEPFKYIVAEVLSVSGAVITFTATLGVDVTVYANEAALQAVTDSGLWAKIGPWGDDYLGGSNYCKGLGTDHGLLRYVGGMNHDITLRNFHIETTLPTDAAMTVTFMMFWKDIMRLSLLNWSCMNFFGGLCHTWRCDDVLVDGLTVRGVGRSKMFEPDQMIVGYVMTAWGGTRITYRNVDVEGKNIQLANTEVSPADILFQNLRYKVNVVRDWNQVGSLCVLSFSGATLGSGVRIEDSSLEVTGSIDDWVWDTNNTVTFKNLVVPTHTFSHFFVLRNHVWEGTLTLGGVVYGPRQIDTETLVRNPPSDKFIFPPKGLYSRLRFRITSLGSCTGMYDYFGNTYAGALGGAWTFAGNQWTQLTPTQPDAEYFSNQRFGFTFNGANPCTVEFDVTYMPAPDSAGWVMD